MGQFSQYYARHSGVPNNPENHHTLMVELNCDRQGVTTMAKIYSIHSIAIKHGRTAEEFECFWRHAFTKGPQVPGINWHLLRGDRGERKGQYVLMAEFDSVELRDHHFPVEGPGAGQYSEEVGQWMGARAALLPQWDKLATLFDQIFTDYVEVG